MTVEANDHNLLPREETPIESTPSGDVSHEVELENALKLMAEQEAETPDEPAAVEAAPASETPEGETPAVEETTEPATEQAAEEPASRRWAAVTKAQKQVEEGRTQLKAERFEVEQLLAQVKDTRAQNEAVAARFKKDPLTVMAELGIPFKVLAQQIATGELTPAGAPAQTPEAAPTSELAQLRAEIQQIRTAEKARNDTATMQGYQNQLAAELQKPEFALLATNPTAADKMLKLSTLHAQQYGEVLSPEMAAATIQAEWKEELSTLKSHGAIREVLGLSPIDQAEIEAQNDERAAAGAPPAAKPVPAKVASLTNAALTPPSAAPKLSQDMTHEEEIAAAISLIPTNATEGLTEF